MRTFVEIVLRCTCGAGVAHNVNPEFVENEGLRPVARLMLDRLAHVGHHAADCRMLEVRGPARPRTASTCASCSACSRRSGRRACAASASGREQRGLSTKYE